MSKYGDVFTREFLEEQYASKEMSTTEIGNMIGCPDAVVAYHLHKQGVPVRSYSEATKLHWRKNGRPKGPASPAWRGGRRVTEEGYVDIYMPGHPRARGGIPGKYVREHFLVWEEHHGEIPKGFHVHHINGDKQDNRIENLAALPSKEHLRLIPMFKERIRELEKRVEELEVELEGRSM